MLAQVFNPTETKKNGPARIPANTPARRRFVFAGLVVLPGTAQSYRDTDTSSSIPANPLSRRVETRSARGVNRRESDLYLIRVA